jgi:hypothetical protein
MILTAAHFCRLYLFLPKEPLLTFKLVIKLFQTLMSEPPSKKIKTVTEEKKTEMPSKKIPGKLR